LLDTGKATLLL